VLTAKGERVPMVEFELVAFLATSTLLVHVAASAAVAFIHGTPDGRGDVARGRNGACIFCLRGAFARTPRPRKATSLEPFEFLGNRMFDDRGQVKSRRLSFGAHQRSEPFQLAVEFGAGRELHLVSARGQGLDDRDGV